MQNMKKILVMIMVALPFTMVAQNTAKLQSRAAAGDTKAMLELSRCYEAGWGVEVDTVKSIALVRQAVAAGDADAKASLSWYYLWYPPLQRDTATALRLTQESMAAGSAEGLARMAFFYQDAIGVERNYGKAWKMLEEAAARGSQRAITVLARGYLYGDDSIDFNPDMAIKYIKRIDENCYSSKFSLMATYLRFKGDMKGSWKWLQKGVAMGNCDAATDAVYARFMGQGTEEDEQGAMQDLAKLKAKYGEDNDMLLQSEFNIRSMATDSTLRDDDRCVEILLKIGDYPYARNYDLLAQSYMFGHYTRVDSSLAEYYWRRGAAKGDVCSIEQLAIWLLNRGDVDSALYYATMAYDRQDNLSANLLGRCWLWGRFYGNEDHQRAKAYFLESARRGNPEDLVMAGKICLWDGDTVEAFKHFDRAIALGYVDAWVNKAYTYIESGNTKPGVALLKKGAKAGSNACLISLGDVAVDEGNYKLAAKYYAQAGGAEGNFKHGRLWLYGALGEGEVEDAQPGVELLRKAISYGSDDASMLLARCYQEGVGVPERPDSTRIIYEKLANRGNEEAMLQLAVYYDNMGDTVQAIGALQRAADANSVIALLTLGEKYIEGEYVPADTARGVALYRRAAELEPLHQGVQVAMAEILLEGLDGTVDTAAAIPYLRRAAENESGWACSQLGDMYYYGYAGFPMDYDSAMMWYYAASNQDYPRGDYMVGRYQDSRGNSEGALSFYVSAARNGHHDAYVEVARALQSGSGVDADPEQAFQMAQNAVDEWQHPEAMMLLGYAYLLGVGVEQDTARGIQYTRQAADLGSTQAMMNMAALYKNGHGVAQDTVAMIQWYQKAVDAASVSAMMRLANIYREGEIVKADPKRAAELYQMAADRGSTDAMCRLGLCYEEGEGVVLNSRKAYNLYMKAADRGSAWGMRLVAFCYAEGIYVQEDEEQTFEWMLKAAESGDLQACYFTGMLYAAGQGVKKNKKEAKKWLTIAAENGMERAAEALQEL